MYYTMCVWNLPKMNFTNVSLNFVDSVVNNVTFFPSAFEEGCIDLENKSISHSILDRATIENTHE